MFDYTVLGAGIVGLSTALNLIKKFPKAKILILEKENSFSKHQTGRNSGVIHSGIYYKPGSFKAKLAKSGSKSMISFCKENGLPYEKCGKFIVATEEKEIPLLEKLLHRGIENGVSIKRVSSNELKEKEPHLKCLSAIFVKDTGITNYKKVSEELVNQIKNLGGNILFEQKVIKIINDKNSYIITTETKEFKSKFIVNCCGLYSDRIVKLTGKKPTAKIIPFRGEYYELASSKSFLIKSLIYPVPNPNFPFLGVHFTKMIDGGIHIGPNAVLAFSREGYKKTDFNMSDFFEVVSYGGFWRLAYKNIGEGTKEIARSFIKKIFVKSAQKMIPEILEEDLIESPSGIRAQALYPDGKLVDDFLFIEDGKILHVCNAPSPAATASLEIGKIIVDKIAKIF
jgi:L-2-hydroxyglutarate oxidase